MTVNRSPTAVRLFLAPHMTKSPRWINCRTLAKNVACAVTLGLVGCVTPVAEPPITPVVAAVAPPVSLKAPAPVPPPVTVSPPASVMPDPPAAIKEPPLVDLPEYAKRGKRLPASGNAPGRAVLSYCKGFELEKDAPSYFKRLQRSNRLPTNEEVVERSRQANQALSVQQVVERDWMLRRDSNKSVPQRCKVLGGSVDGATALIVFEAELNGRRQRGVATVVLVDKNWRVRDHGDWAPAK